MFMAGSYMVVVSGLGRSHGEGQSTPVFLPGEFHGQSLADYSPWGHKGLDMTETNTFNFGFL